MSVEQLSPLGSSANSAPSARTPQRQARRLWLAVVTLGLLAVIAVSVGLYAIDRSYADRIYPHVTVRGVAVGELSATAARQAIEQHFAPFLAQPVTLTYADHTWTPTLAELGVRIELDRAVAMALAAGRQNGFLTNLREMFAVYQNGLEVPLHLTVDQATMQAYMLQRVAEVEQPAVDATLTLNGTTISSIPSALGQQVLMSETLQEITAALQSLDPQQVALRTRELQPRLSDATVREAQATIASLLAGPLTFTVEGQTAPVVWSLEDLAGLVRVERVVGSAGDTLTVSADPALVMAKLVTLANATEDKGSNPRVDWNGGDLRITKDGTSGRRVDEERAAPIILAALAQPATARTLVLPMREVPSPVTAANLNQLGLTALLSVGQSDFSGSAAYRITNIKVGMRLLNGILVAPGAEFSFNDSVGQIDASNGFVEGYAIVSNRTQLDWGGGICQDSTTMFRAAFWAGLPITERWGHSFYISWYNKYAFAAYGDGPGMDATIFTGALDFKFLNDTGHWLLVQSGTYGSVAEIRIYGTNDGRTVNLIGPVTTNRVPAPTAPVYVADPKRPRGSPRQSDTARGGMTITFTRVIERNGQAFERREFQTQFRAWPNIFEINPADLGGNGRPIPQPTRAPAPVDPQPTDVAPPQSTSAPEPSTVPPPAPIELPPLLPPT
ncbi:MAG: VanW family protein [Chloroflexales bacterium]